MSKDALKSGHSLEARHRTEEEYHDKKYSTDDSSPKHYKLNPTFRIFKRMTEMIGDVSGKKILEYGCGSGWMTAELASLGAEIDSFDISAQAVESTKSLLERHNLHGKCTVRKMSAEELEYPDGSFDIVFGFAILHHLDLDKAIGELHRVLKPGGYAIFAEPLEGNPGLRIYRALTPNYRTADERPIDIGEFKGLVARFDRFTHEEFYLTALAPFALIYLPGGARFFEAALKPFMALDRALLKVFPVLGGWAWYSVLKMQK